MQSIVRLNWRRSFAATAILASILIALITFTIGCGESADVPESAENSAPGNNQAPFCLTTEFFPIPHDANLMRLPLVRELGRQAVLIAARDGLGLPTRDQTLGESFPDDAASRLGPFDVTVRAYNAGNASISILPPTKADKSGQRSIEPAKFDFNFQSDTYNMYTALAAQLGAATRSELVDALRNAGCTGQAVKVDPNGVLPDGVELLLAEMNFVSQFAAVRRIHGAIQQAGESPARLGGLVRGYANLAMLTRHHWNSSHAAFAARALLYGERMIALGGNDRLAYQHRAYARALVGLHGIALQDLDRLPAAEGDTADIERTASWTEVTEPFCRFNDKQLDALAGKPGLAQLVPQLAFELKACYGDPRWTSDAGKASVQACPEAFGIYAEMADNAPMLVQREAVGLSTEAFGRRLPRRAASIADLPAPAARLVSELARPRNSLISQRIDGKVRSAALSPVPMQLAESLWSSESAPFDTGEPSWQTLAQLIADEQFIELANYLEVSLNAVESSKQGLVDRMAPLVKAHPYGPYILSFAVDGKRQPAELAELVGKIRVFDPRGKMQQLFDLYQSARDASGATYDELSDEALWQNEYHLPGLIESLANVHESWWKSPQLVDVFQRLVVDLQAISPHSPTVVRMEINTTVDPNPEQLTEWESRAQSDPKALTQVGALFAERRLFEPAIRCYSRSYDLSPNHNSAISLAKAYRNSGQSDKWLPTLERYLQVEDHGLGHSIIHREIALDHIERHEWAEAEPHALESANTWSTMGLITASRVYEGMLRWEESERWIREATINYPTYNGMQWYLWCRRTGRGDRQQAKQYADDFMRHSWLARPENGVHYPFLNDMFESRYDDGLTRIGKSPSCTGDPYWQFQAAVLAKQLGRHEQYEQAMKSAMDLANQQLRETEPQLHAFVAILFAGRNGPDFTDAQLADADKLLDGFSVAERCNCAYYLGELLELKGNAKGAETYWRIALESGQFDNRHATLAGWQLAEKFGTSRPDAAKDEVKEGDAEESPADNSL